MKKIIIILACFLPMALFAQDASNMLPLKKVVNDTASQKDLLDLARQWFNIHSRTIRSKQENKVYFSILPVSGTVPGGAGRALITSTTAGIYLGPIATTNISSINFAPYWNFKSRYGLPLRTSVWLPGNTWNIQGDMRYLVYPLFTWGLGTRNNNNNKTLVGDDYFRFYQSALKQITPFFYAGLGYNLDSRSDIKTGDPEVNLKQFAQYAYGTNRSSLSSGVSLNLLYDTRRSSINPLPGAYANLVYRINPTFMGSDNSWNSLYIDLRKYFSLNPERPSQQNTLAFWSYFWTVFNSNAPYLDLPSIGWDPYNRSGEGIEQSRYRGKSLFYFESEYRRDITDNGLLGFVAFANVNSVSGSGSLFTSWHPAAGTGLRLKFNKGSNTNIGMDYAFSKGYNSLIFNVGEAF